ncbi:hypothetical protein HHI36_014430, partial [Cryptolaemus montrouzieri]
MIEDRQHIANEFNKYFATIGKRLAEKCGVNVEDSPHKPLRNPNTIAFFLSDETEVIGIIKQLKNNKATMDEIKAEILKKIAPFILTPLTYLINESIT